MMIGHLAVFLVAQLAFQVQGCDQANGNSLGGQQNLLLQLLMQNGGAGGIGFGGGHLAGGSGFFRLTYDVDGPFGEVNFDGRQQEPIAVKPLPVQTVAKPDGLQEQPIAIKPVSVQAVARPQTTTEAPIIVNTRPETEKPVGLGLRMLTTPLADSPTPSTATSRSISTSTTQPTTVSERSTVKPTTTQATTKVQTTTKRRTSKPRIN